MNQEFEIELFESEHEEEQPMQLPLNFVSVGSPENEEVKVYIKQEVYRALEKLAASNTSKELGSILLGSHTEALGKTHVVISAYIEAKYTDASASTLTFTHETWDYVYKEKERSFPQDKIVGWQHTHPSYGIFLSNYDLFIQENFFDMPFQVAYVIDPVQNMRGFFCRKNGKIEKLPGFYVYDDPDKPVKIKQAREQQAARGETPGKRKKLVPILLALLLLLTAALTAATALLYYGYQKQSREQEALTQRVQAQEEQLCRQEEQLSALQQAPPTEHAAEASENPEQQTEQAPVPEEPPAQSQTEQVQYASFIVYTVNPGDSLSSICAENGIDYAANWRMIVGLNGINDPDILYPGQKLLLPLE